MYIQTKLTYFIFSLNFFLALEHSALYQCGVRYHLSGDGP